MSLLNASQYVVHVASGASRKIPSFGFPTSSETNRVVKPMKMDIELKFRIYEVVALCYVSGKTKDAGTCAADLRLLFSYMQNAGFLMIRLIFFISSL